MHLHDIKTLYAFNYWAKKRIMEIVETLSFDQCRKDMGSSHGGIRGTLVHTMGAEEVWLKRWKGETTTGLPKEDDFQTIESLADRWKTIETNVLRFCEELKSDDDIMRRFEYKDLKGNAYTAILYQAMQHLVNHSSYHRGQIVTLLRQQGMRPVATDLIAFYREHHPT